MQSAPKDLLKEYVQSQQFTSTAEVMQAMKEMFRDVIEQVMEVEMDDELGRERCQRSDEPEGQARNYRNGYSKKTVKTQLGEVEIKVPRDRQGNYEPKIIGKYDRNAEGMEEKILAGAVRLRDEPAGHLRADQGAVRRGDLPGAGQ